MGVSSLMTGLLPITYLLVKKNRIYKKIKIIIMLYPKRCDIERNLLAMSSIQP